METQEFLVDPKEAGKRLDVFVAQASGLSRARVQGLIEAGDVLVAGHPQKARYLVRAGERIGVTVPPAVSLDLVPEPFPLEILFEDEQLLVLNKPAGLVVHPGAGRRTGTLVHALLAHCRDLPGIGGVERPGIVHRLDRDTSGVMLVAKTDLAHHALSHQFKTRIVRKRYLALVHGELGQDAGRIEANIGRREDDRKRMGVKRKGGREAVTTFRVLARSAGRTLLDLGLETGRTHQIRVHLAHIGHPVVGDQMYGGRRERHGKGEGMRQLLHAWRIGFRHPTTEGWLEFEAPIPADFRQALGTDVPIPRPDRRPSPSAD
jgi:23S rRNA pseudouridine1911/1915/1917 synthase